MSLSGLGSIQGEQLLAYMWLSHSCSSKRNAPPSIHPPPSPAPPPAPPAPPPARRVAPQCPLQTAIYPDALLAPACLAASSSDAVNICTSGDLLDGRGAGGDGSPPAELNSINAVLGTCSADGTDFSVVEVGVASHTDTVLAAQVG